MKILFFMLVFCCGAGLSAQHIGYLLPAGGKQGTTVEVQVAGQQFWGIQNARVSGRGVTVDKVIVVPGIPNVNYHQRRFLTSWMNNVIQGRNEVPKIPEDPDIVKSFRKHAYFDRIDQLSPLQFHILTESFFLPRHPLQMSPAIGSLAIVRLTIAPDAPVGRRELRLVRSSGHASNPLPFYVDTLSHIREPLMPIPPKKRPTPVFQIPSAVNGQIHPGSSDIWLFQAKKGQKLVFETFARKLIPFMGDCVPGYFQCMLEIRNDKNALLAHADDNGFDPDPVLEWRVPADGQYRLVVRDALFRGRADFVYRIRAYEGKYERRMRSLDGFETVARKKYEDLDGVTPYPVIVEGTLKAKETHFVVFEAKKGEKIACEVFARRLNSHLDSLLQITCPDGKLVAGNDDYERSKVGLVMQNADSKILFTAPRSGKYTVAIRDTAGNGGKDYSYYLRIDHFRPSFSIHIVPSAIRAGMNANTIVPLRIERYEGFNEDIRLSLNAHSGTAWISGSNVIPAGADKSLITVGTTHEEDARRRIVPLEVTLEAVSGKIRGEVVAGDEATQAFAYTHVIPAESVMLSKVWTHGSGMCWYVDPALTRLHIPCGGTAVIRIGRRRLGKNQSFDVVLKNAPAGLTIRSKTRIDRPRGYADIILVIHADKKLAGKRFNLPLTGVHSYPVRDHRRKRFVTRHSEVVLPAILFEIGENKK